MYAIVYIAVLVLYFVINGLLTSKLKKVNLAEGMILLKTKDYNGRRIEKYGIGEKKRIVGSKAICFFLTDKIFQYE